MSVLDDLCALSPSYEYKEHLSDESEGSGFGQAAWKEESPEGKNLIHYPGLFEVRLHCRDSLLLFPLMQRFIYES